MPHLKFLKPEIKDLVSVIIPAYNRKNYIKQTVESVLEQTYKNFELIVVDDGSTDGTLNILQGYRTQMTLLQHPNGENRGQAASINLGLSHSNGEFIAILDSDDYWKLSYLENMVDYLNPKLDIGMAYSNGHAVDENGEYIYTLLKKDHIERNHLGDILCDCYLCLPGASLVRRSVYEKVGNFDVSLRAGQDHDMCIRISEETQLGYNNKELFYYRKHQDTISTNALSVRWRNGFIILKKAMDRVHYPKRIIYKRKAVLNYRLGQALKTEGAIVNAIFHFFLAGIQDPIRALKVITKYEVKH
ncbi:MAG: glycosyltransferase [Gammaproteobacteria bacterium]|nr:glycosyltransferase [Gammaproteobacteria bacterium]